MTAAEVARELGIATNTVYDLCAARRLAHHRVGVGRGKIVVVRADLDAYLASVRVAAEPVAPRPEATPPGRPGPRPRALPLALALRQIEELLRDPTGGNNGVRASR